MISRDIQHQVATLRELLRTGQLTQEALVAGLDAIDEAADRVAEIEAMAVPAARRHAGVPGVVDFRAHKAAREMEDYMAARGLAAVSHPPPDGPEDAA